MIRSLLPPEVFGAVRPPQSRALPEARPALPVNNTVLNNTVPASRGGAAVSARQDEALRAVAKDFEGLFLSEVFKAMQSTVARGPLTGGYSQEVFNGMLQEQFARLASTGTGVGLSDMLYEQLAGERDGLKFGGYQSMCPVVGSVPQPQQPQQPQQPGVSDED